jgi:DNA mismatch repair protein MutL
MPRIQTLSPLVVAQIAAGEVIERPASVVKELLENSIDAGSTRIDVDVSQGGLELIRVVDDGCGIDPDDLPLAFATHATSKLRDAADLFALSTLGFRGEGLASIGGIAQVALQSRPPERPCGAEVSCHGGQLSPVRVWAGSPGTRVEVRHLFYNVPARRKFLRGAATEMAQVIEVVTRLALSQLSLHLTLRHNNKVVHDIPTSAGLLDRIGLFFGAELRKQLHMVEAEQGRITLGGYVADPMCERNGTQMQYVFLNGRWIRDRGLSQALQEAYRGLLMTGRHPVAFLFLEMPPDQVDVNVHPTKAEVRFRDPDKVQRLVHDTVRARLQREDLTAALRAPQPAAPAVQSQTTLPFDPPSTPRPAPAEVRPLPPAPRSAPASSTPAPRPAPASVAAPAAERRTSPPTPPPEVKRAPAPAAVSSPAPAVRPIKAIQFHDLYLVVEVPEGILVIDQHALHERILYEQLQARWRAGNLEVQRLLIPEPVNLSAGQAALVLEQREALSELGLEVSDFGGGTVLLGAYPALLGKRGPRDVLQAVVDYLGKQERVPDREVLLNDLLSLMACHAAVRAGDRLTPEEIAALVEQRHLAQDAHHCPHGRPTSLMFTRHELDRQFRRV